MFFELRPKKATLSDKNEELINCYKQVKSNAEAVISSLQNLKNTKADYYEVRKTIPETPAGRAARLIYLMGLSFNGIYRVNADGGFNVPYGKKRGKKFDYEHIRNVSKAFVDTEFVHSDFVTAVDGAKQGDLIYFDPPYTVAHGNNGFVQYNEKIFSWSDQVKLSELASSLVQRGCHVVVSNAAHVSIAKIYTDFEMKIVSRHSGIGGPLKSRRQITEYVFTKKTTAS